MNTIPSFGHLSDERLVEEVGKLAISERQATAALIASLAEFDRRRLHLALGYASMFDYCRKVLCLSEHEALSAHGLEFHHVRPYAVGGETSTSNIEMRCRAHNGFEWQQHLEGETMNLVEQMKQPPQWAG